MCDKPNWSFGVVNYMAQWHFGKSLWKCAWCLLRNWLCYSDTQHSHRVCQRLYYSKGPPRKHTTGGWSRERHWCELGVVVGDFRIYTTQIWYLTICFNFHSVLCKSGPPWTQFLSISYYILLYIHLWVFINNNIPFEICSLIVYKCVCLSLSTLGKSNTSKFSIPL